MNEIIHDTENKRFLLNLEEGNYAYVSYTLDCGVMRLVHSFVPFELRGQGIGKKLVEQTFQKLSDEGYEATAVCSYVVNIAKRHPKWSTIINFN